MALFLHLDTSTPICSVALSEDDKLLVINEIDDQQHASHLTLSIENTLQQVGRQLRDLDAISIAKGPGSYTGLRIGVATAKAICFALHKPLIAIDSMLPLAWAMRQQNTAPDALFLPMIDARRMDAYCAIYDNQLQLLQPIDCRTPDALWLQPYAHQNIIFGGNAVPKFKNQDWANSLIDSNLHDNSAAHLVGPALQAYQLQQFENIYTFEPFYLKPPAFTTAR